MSANTPLRERIKALEDELHRTKEDYLFLFNHPCVRFLRGLRQLRSKPKVGLNDLRMSVKHAIFGRKRRKLPRAAPIKIDVTGAHTPLFKEHPFLFFHDMLPIDKVFVIGKPHALIGCGQHTITPENYAYALSGFRESWIVINLEDGLDGTEWHGLFTMHNMRVNRIFADICLLAEGAAFRIAIMGQPSSVRQPLFPAILERHRGIVVPESLLPKALFGAAEAA